MFRYLSGIVSIVIIKQSLSEKRVIVCTVGKAASKKMFKTPTSIYLHKYR